MVKDDRSALQGITDFPQLLKEFIKVYSQDERTVPPNNRLDSDNLNHLIRSAKRYAHHGMLADCLVERLVRVLLELVKKEHQIENEQEAARSILGELREPNLSMKDKVSLVRKLKELLEQEEQAERIIEKIESKCHALSRRVQAHLQQRGGVTPA